MVELPARDHRVPLRGVDLLERRVHPDLLEIADHEGGEVEVDRDRARDDLELERVGRTEAGLGEQLPGGGASLGGPAVARELVEILLEQAPHAPRLGREGGADDRGPAVHGLGIGAAIDREAERAPHLDVVEGRLLGVEQEVLADVARGLGEDHAGHRALELLHDRERGLARVRHVDLVGLERGHPRAALHDDGVAHAVQVGAALDEVVRVAHELDRLAALPLLELERAGADAARAVLGDGTWAGITGE